ncbi:MAG: hypothetical protein RLZZ46_1024 [Bacteroidota bacterium]|jgi:hypothetical protein
MQKNISISEISNMFRIPLFLLFFLLSQITKAQFSGACIDSTRIIAGPACYFTFDPYCGCDNVTYQNQCWLNNAGVQYYTQGPCDAFALSIDLNPTVEFLYLSVVFKQPANMRLFITDLWGRFYYNAFYDNQSFSRLTIPVSTFPAGMYLVFIESDGLVKHGKLVKVDF